MRLATLGKTYRGTKRTRRRRPEGRRQKRRPKQREINDGKYICLFPWTRVTVRPQGTGVKRAIIAFHTTEVMIIIIISLITDCIVIQLRRAERCGQRTFQNQRAGPARGIPKMYASSITSQRLTRTGPRISVGFHWLISAHGGIAPMEYFEVHALMKRVIT